jgi:hypothetical protein
MEMTLYYLVTGTSTLIPIAKHSALILLSSVLPKPPGNCHVSLVQEPKSLKMPPYTPSRQELFAPDLRAETYGTANPTVMNKPFWQYMAKGENGADDPLEVLVGFGVNFPDELRLSERAAYKLKKEEIPEVLRATEVDLDPVSDRFAVQRKMSEKTGRVPIWTGSRDGQAQVTLPDGRVVRIAGGGFEFTPTHPYCLRCNSLSVN